MFYPLNRQQLVDHRLQRPLLRRYQIRRAAGHLQHCFQYLEMRDIWDCTRDYLQPSSCRYQILFYTAAYDEISMILRRNHVTNFANNNSMNGESKSTATIEDIEDAKRQPYIPLVAGSTARLLASLATAPLELIRTRQASNTKAQKGMVEEFRLLLRTNGISSLYVGLAPTLWRDVPFSAIYWLFLERFRNALGDSEELGGWGGSYYRERGVDIPPGIQASHAFVSGAGAGSIAAAFTT